MACHTPASSDLSHEFAQRWQLAWAEQVSEAYPYWLCYDAQGVSLHSVQAGFAPLRVDFGAGVWHWRQQHGGGAGQAVAKAIGVKGARCPSVLDATAGLGRESWILAGLGCQVQMLERSPVVHALLADGLQRALCQPELASVVQRLQLLHADAGPWLVQQSAPVAEVVYLDPMYPHANKSALVKKEMRIFRDLVGGDVDADALLEPAWAVAECRVVVKRPKHAPLLAGRAPSHQLQGKTTRFDVYVKAGFSRADTPG